MFGVSEKRLREFKEWCKENVKTRTARSRTREGKRFKEWCKENVKTRTARSRTREGKRLGKTSFLDEMETYAA
ncbi:hypothetical protein T03_4574, partial [Trichinella britovi]